MSDNQYFAAKEGKETASIVLQKANNWFTGLNSNGYLDQLRTMYAAYYGAYYTDTGDANTITFGGEQGEYVQIAVNHLNNLALHMLNMITSVRPTMQARSVNTDYKSMTQTKLANGVLDYYMREKRLENHIKKACEMAIVLGSGYVKLEWNSTSGEVHDFDEDLQTDIYEGDIEITNLSPFDVIFDVSREDQKHDWILTRSWKNKYDIAAKFPEYADQIVQLETKSQLNNFYLDSFYGDDTDLIPVYEFYHKRSESMKNGRYLMFLSDDIVLLDSPMPYRNLPVYRIAPSDIMGTPFGYSPLFGILPIQDAVNSLHSTVLTNQTAFGVQSIIGPKGSDISVTELATGLTYIEADERNGAIRPLQLTATPKEVFDYIQMLEKAMETISGVNAVARGNPDPSLRSGNALALVQSMTLQFMSGLQQSYVALIEDLGTGIINILKDYATVPRVAAIVGKTNRTYMKEFTGEDLTSINRVIVEVGNALARCLEKDTPVLMFDGSIKMVQDIQIGDKVMGPDSKERTVTNTNSGTEMMYKVRSKDKYTKIEYGCNESHILTLKYCSDDPRYNAKKGDVVDLSVKEYLSLPSRHKRLLQGFKTAIDFKEKELPIPPYILGAWLGDGHHDQTAITTTDPEILNEWTSYANSIGMQVRKSTNSNCGAANIYFITSGQQSGKPDRNFMLNELKSLEVYKNKHIPKFYLTTSRQQRLDLLAGLIDTDGYRNGETYIFTQKRDQLANDVVFLSRSLGFKTNIRKQKSSSSKLVGEIHGDVNIVTIGGNTWEIPSRLPRKQCSPIKKQKDWLNYGITVVPAGEGTYYGFTLEEEPHFVLGDFTVTHNTTAGRVEMAEQLLQMGLISTPQQYFSVMNTGNLDVMTEDEQAQLFLVKGENEYIVEGKPVFALFNDDHNLHIKEHGAVLSDPEMRLNSEIVQRTLAHIQEHMDLLKGSQPPTPQTPPAPQPSVAYLQIVGQQPLPPDAPPPQPQQPLPQDGGQQIPAMMDPAQQMDPMSLVQPQNLPQPAQAPDVNGIPQPGTPEEMMAQSMGGQPVGS